MRLSAGDRAPNAELSRPDGVQVRLSDLWKDSYLVLNFMRHFG